MLVKKVNQLIGGLLILLTLVSCDKLNKPEKEPVYLKIDSFDLETISGEGTDRHNIKDAVVFANDQLLGIFELPVEIPILEEGYTNFKIRPGIRANGISTEHKTYPFFEQFEVNKDLIAGETIEIEPLTSYNEFAQFELIEDFDNPGVNFVDAAASDAVYTVETNSGVEGQYGSLELGSGESFARIETNVNMNLPNTLSRCFVELDYRTNADVRLGVIALRSSGDVDILSEYGINPKTSWNRIYIELTPRVLGETQTNNFEFFIQFTMPEGASSSYLHLDNVKIIYR